MLHPSVAKNPLYATQSVAKNPCMLHPSVQLKPLYMLHPSVNA